MAAPWPHEHNFRPQGMTEVELDTIGRFMLPRTMVRYSAIEKEAIIVGLGNRCEDLGPRPLRRVPY